MRVARTLKAGALAGRHRAAGEEGMLLIELMLAAVVLVVAIIGLALGFDSARRLSAVAERQTTAAHRARLEVERVQGLAYSAVAMSAVPTHSADTTNPDYYVASGTSTCATPGTFQYDPNNTSAIETLVCDASNGQIPATGTAWSDGPLAGMVYDFITWHSDGSCGSGCPTSQNYKRLTVEVTVTTRTNVHAMKPVVISTVIADPTAHSNAVTNGVQNPLDSPQTTCTNGSGQQVNCSAGIDQGSANNWILHDYPASGSSPAAPTADHSTHATVAPNGTCTAGASSGTGVAGCPQPDLMNASSPSQSSSSTLFNYSTDIGGKAYNPGATPPGLGFDGGRILKPDTGCANTPTSTDNSKGELWVTAPLSSSLTLTGYGGLTLYTETLNAASTAVTLCLAVYDVPNSIVNLPSSPPTELGSSAYNPPSWPTTMTADSFDFQFLSSGTATVASGHRIGVRLWLSSASTGSIAVAYDHPLYASQVQLNSQ